MNLRTNRKTMKNAILIILAIVFLQACGDATLDPNSIEKVNVDMPLKIGNYWVRTLELTNGYTKDTSITKIVSDTLIDNEVWYKMIAYTFHENNNNEDSSFAYYINKIDGRYAILPNDMTKKYNSSKPETFVGDIFETQSFTKKTVSTNLSLNVNNVIYSNVVKYKLINKDGVGHSFEYFAPNIGTIKTESYDTNDNSELYAINELIEYKVN
jgi:hypothetical protein